MSKTVAEIEIEIQAIKVANPDWITRPDIIALITEFMKEKNNISGNFISLIVLLLNIFFPCFE
jgi:hypothetical protein